MFLVQMLLLEYGQNDFVSTIEETIEYAKAGDWENADIKAQTAREIWAKGHFIVALKYSESDYIFLNIYLTRFDSAVKQKDTKEVEKEGLSSIYIFKNITSISPEP